MWDSLHFLRLLLLLRLFSVVPFLLCECVCVLFFLLPVAVLSFFFRFLLSVASFTFTFIFTVPLGLSAEGVVRRGEWKGQG